VAGIIATAIGLILGLVSGYMGGMVDDIIMFITNLFIVIPSFVLLDPDFLQHRPGTARRLYHRRGDRLYVLGLDGQGRARAGDFAAQPRSRQPVEALRPLHRPHHRSATFCPTSPPTSSWP
jgi:hypothetical protein